MTKTFQYELEAFAQVSCICPQTGAVAYSEVSTEEYLVLTVKADYDERGVDINPDGETELYCEDITILDYPELEQYPAIVAQIKAHAENLLFE